MSCFAGKLKEYPCFSVDCFDKLNLDSDVYFLSHCHKDHMNGLDSTTFFNRLKSSQNVLVYCSETTKNILLCDLNYKHLEDYVVGLPIEHPTMITVKNDQNGKSELVCVTLLPAGHCIGSVMFLFEGNNGNVLYTGDYRLSKGAASRMPFFHSADSVKDITSIYVDTTFCLPQMKEIPSREATKNAVVGLIKRWLKQGPNYYVSLLCKGMYGYEYLLKEVAMDLKTKIHVSRERLTLYSNLPDMTEHFTTDAKTTKIHSCNWEQDRYHRSNLPCGLTVPAPQKVKVMKIKASSMWFARRKEPLPANCVVKVNQDFYRVVHSMHASMEEIFDLLGYLRPLHIYATVEPAGLHSIQHTEESLKRFTRFNGCDSPNNENSEETRFQEQAVAFDNKIVGEEIPALCKDQKSSNIVLLSDAASRPSEEVLAQCKQLGLVDDALTAIPRRRRRRKSQEALEKVDKSDENMFKKTDGDAVVVCQNKHPHKRRLLQNSEELNEKTDETHATEKIAKESKFLVTAHACGDKSRKRDNGINHEKVDLSHNELLSTTPSTSSLKFQQNISCNERTSNVNDTTIPGYEEYSRAGVVRDNKCSIGDVKDASEYYIPGSPGHDQPSQEMLCVIHDNLGQGGWFDVPSSQDT